MKFLITGANGLLGQKLISLLSSDESGGHSLIATSVGPNRNSSTRGYEYCQLDITNGEIVSQVIHRYNPDVVINTAAMTNVDQCETDKEGCWNLNVNAVAHLVKACDQNHCKLIHLSTDFIFDGLDGPYIEEANPNPLSYYGESKFASEKVLMNSKIQWAIARTVLVYGIVSDMSRSNIILWVKKSLEEGKQIKVVTDQWRTPTLAEDLAMGCYLIGTREQTGIFNISGKDLLTPYDMAIMVADYYKLDKSLIEKADSSTFSQPAKRPAKTGFIIDKARDLLGYDPHTFEEGIELVKSQIESN